MEQKTDIFHKDVKRRIWTHSWTIALFLFVSFLFLVYKLDDNFDFLTISKSLAGTSALLFGFSFALSGFCYWWDFLDTKIAYRKQLGLVAYFLALSYSLSLLILDPHKYLFGFFKNLFTADVLLGTISMTIFTFLALISTDKMMMKIGPKKWRYALRFGYLAWLLLALRAYVIEQDLWMAYLKSFEGFPPPRLLLSLYVLAILAFRISVDVSKKCVPFTNKKLISNNK